MLALPVRRKPGRGLALDRAHPLARGLLAFVPCWEGGATFGRPYDLASGLSLVPSNSFAAFSPGPAGLGVVLNYPGSCCTANMPLNLLPRWPITLAMGFRSLGTRAAGCPIAGLAAASAWTAPYAALAFNFAGASFAAMNVTYNAGGTNSTLTNLAPLPVGVDLVWSASFGANAQAAYSNGQAVYTASQALADPTYGSGPLLLLGTHPALSTATPNVLIYWLMMWNRYLPAGEHAQLAMDPWRILVPFTDNWFIQAAPTPPSGAGAFPVVGSAIIRHPAA